MPGPWEKYGSASHEKGSLLGGLIAYDKPEDRPSWGESIQKELTEGHSPEAIEPTTAAEIMTPMIMGGKGMQSIKDAPGASEITGPVRSASYGNLSSAAEMADKAKGLIGDTASKGAGLLGSGAKKIWDNKEELAKAYFYYMLGHGR